MRILLPLAIVLAARSLCAAPPPEVLADWLAQDKLASAEQVTKQAVVAILDKLGAAGADVRKQLDDAELAGRPLAAVYANACELRRQARLKPVLDKLAKVVFTKHFDMGGSHYAYAEGQSDAQNERHFRPGTALCLLEMNGLYGQTTALIEDPKGVIRDPDVSHDGQRILFAWKKDDRKDDYHLYEMSVADGAVRQLTDGLGFADYECAYLPSGDIVFNSTRCVQIVDCWWTEVSNLYTCDRDGRYLRRLGFDQVHTNFPTVTHDGRVIYTRWDYNDRGQIYPQGLFQMYPDGTGQTALYGNNTWFPTTILHARSIPGTGKYVAIFSGHHTRQKGWLGLLNPARGRQENAGAQLIAPVRPTPAVHVDAYGQSGDQWQYPYPLDETNFLVTFRTEKAPNFAIYWMNIAGERELLASDPKVSCNQPVPLAPRPVPHVRPPLSDYASQSATLFLQDVYAGWGLEGVERGTVKALRVVTLEFRVAGIGQNGNAGPAGGALASTPISIQGAWDPKTVLGTARVYEDGSACFKVPARTPVYFQALDAKGHAVQTMRSWVTLQPGESVSCVGCHENKNSTPPVQPISQALARGPEELTPWQGGPRGFSFPREIQPILDTHCVKCHHLDTPPRYSVASFGPKAKEPRPAAAAFDPKTMRVLTPADARWWHTFTKPGDGWMKPEFDASAWRISAGGFGKHGVPGGKVKTLWHTADIWLRLDFDLKEKPKFPALLCHHDDDAEVYINGVLAAQAPRFTIQYEVLPIEAKAAAALRVGQNTLAVHCRYDGGGQYIDAALIEAGPPEGNPKSEVRNPKPENEEAKASFSLRGKPVPDGGSRRVWSDSYLALANRGVANWINIQSEPSRLPPYHAGAAKSKLITLLEQDHYGVKLSHDELDRFAVWIDLLVPFCGDYTESNAWSDAEKAMHDRYLAKRKRMADFERASIQALLTGAPGPVAASGPAEAAGYRNVALNPNDLPGKEISYPHATSNSEYNQTCFAARCAIDGKTENRGHGPKFPSWGPDKRKDLWWKVEFGRPVEVDKVVLYIRADFPHDNYWHTGVIEFSDGSREKIAIQKAVEPQSFAFKKRTVTWLKLTDLVQTEPLGWCAFTEVEVWGR